MREKIKVAIVEDEPIYRMVLDNYLQQNEDFEIIISCSNGKELIEGMLKNKPDVVLSDLKMPVMDGIKITEYLNKHYPEIKILILTMYNGENLSHDLIEKGANIFLLKDNGIEQVSEAIYALFKYEHYFAGWSSKKTTPSKIEGISYVDIAIQDEIILNEEEKKLLKYICEGLSNKEIADKLSLSLRTIENKRAIMFKKTKTNNIAKLIRFALRNKII